MNLIIDTNLLVAAAFNPSSASAKILVLAKQGQVNILWSQKTKKEAKLILGNLKNALGGQNKKPDFAKKLIEKTFRPKNKIALKNMPEVGGSIEVIKKDPEDAKFLEAAQVAGVDMIVSNDRHLLELKNFRGIPIYTPKKALGKLT